MVYISTDGWAVIIAIASFVISVFTYWYTKKTTKMSLLMEYYAEDNTKEMIELRREIYHMTKEQMMDLESDDTKRAWICSYYHFYANLYLSKAIDQKMYIQNFGWVTVNIYEKLEPYIMARKERDNRNYASQFEDLVKSIKASQEYKKLCEKNKGISDNLEQQV